MTARDIRFGLILAMCASYVGPGLLTQTANAQDLAARGDQLQVQQSTQHESLAQRQTHWRQLRPPDRMLHRKQDRSKSRLLPRVHIT